MAVDTLRLGVAGLGRAFSLMLPTFARDPRVRLVAAADPRPEARAKFVADFGGRACGDVGELLREREVEAVYVATPHELHAGHAIAAARAGKHVLVEKPMAVTLEDARRMVAAAEEAGTVLVVGHSHSFDAPVAAVRRIVASGEVGRVRMITSIQFTDFLYRPRRPEELDTARGGGVLFSQAAHQVDIARLLAGSAATSVRCHAGAWDPSRPTEGAYGALVAFEGGAFATLTYSGYGRFDSDELCGWIGETGRPRDPAAYATARAALAHEARAADEAAAKQARNYGGAGFRDPRSDEPWHEHFGPLIVSCEKGDLRPLPNGVWIYGESEKRFEPLPKPAVPRAEVIDELFDALRRGTAPLHDGRSGLASLEICLAMLESARTGAEVRLRHQLPMG